MSRVMLVSFKIPASLFTLVWLESLMLSVFAGPSPCQNSVEGMTPDRGFGTHTHEPVKNAISPLSNLENLLNQGRSEDEFSRLLRDLSEGELWVDSGRAAPQLFEELLRRRQRREQPNMPSVAALTSDRGSRANKDERFFWQDAKEMERGNLASVEAFSREWIERYEYADVITDIHIFDGLLSRGRRVDQILDMYLQILQPGGVLYLSVNPMTLFIRDLRGKSVTFADYLSRITGAKFTLIKSYQASEPTVIARIEKKEDRAYVPELVPGRTFDVRGVKRRTFRLIERFSSPQAEDYSPDGEDGEGGIINDEGSTAKFQDDRLAGSF